MRLPLRAQRDRAARRLARPRRLLHRDDAVALTFDDGPDATFTPRVLEVLARHEVHATFFVVGDAARREPGLVREVVAAGHAVGSHSMTHPEVWTLSARALHREYRDGRAVVEDITGAPVTRFRPPNGYVDLNGALAMRALGLRPWLWTHDSLDWEPGATASSVAAVGVEPGSVVLLHDGLFGPRDPSASDRSATVAALEPLLAAGRDAGLRFVPVPA